MTIRNLTIDGNANGALSGDHHFRAGVMTDHTVGVVFDNITVQDVTVLHTYRRAIQVFSNSSVRQSVGDIVTGNTITDVTLGPGITCFDCDGEISHNTISGIPDGSGIEGVQWSASGGFLLDIHENTISGVYTGLQLVVPRGGTSVVGNTITLTGLHNDEIGMIVRNAVGQVTVQRNKITCTAGGAGIWMFGNAVPVVVTANTLQASASVGGTPGLATGIFMSDDGRLFTDGNGNPVADLPTNATITSNAITGFVTGVDLYRNGINPAGGQSVQATINYNDLSGNTNGVKNADAGYTVDARYNWWGSPTGPTVGYNVGLVNVTPWAGALAASTTASTHEVGETGTLDTKVTVSGLYGVQFVLNHTPSVLTWDSGAKFNAGTAPNDWDWSKTFLAKDFAVGFPAAGQTTLAATLQSPTPPLPPKLPANLVNDKLATWKYKCTGVGTSPLVYDTTTGTGSYLADKDGFNIPAVWLGDSITCVAATGSVDGYIKLQGRLATNPHPASWYGAEVTLTCASGRLCRLRPVQNDDR